MKIKEVGIMEKKEDKKAEIDRKHKEDINTLKELIKNDKRSSYHYEG